MAYSSEYSSAAQRYLDRLAPNSRARVLRQVEAICEDPYNPRLSKPLHGELASVRSSRVGNLRVIVRVIDERVVVVVVRIGPRGDVYKS